MGATAVQMVRIAEANKEVPDQRLAAKHLRGNSRSKHPDRQQSGGNGERKAALCRSDFENIGQDWHEWLNTINKSERAERSRNQSYIDPPKSPGTRLNVFGWNGRLRLRGWLQFNLLTRR